MIYLTFFVVASALPIVFAHKKFNTDVYLIVFLFLSVFIFLSLSLNSQNQDFEAYLLIFDSPEDYAELGYVYLIEVLKVLSFSSHRSVLFVLAFLLLVTLTRVYLLSRCFSLFIFIYLLFLFPVDVVQIRNTFSTLFAVNAIIFLHKRRYIACALFSGLSISFHLMGLTYVFIIFGGQLSWERIKKYGAIILIPVGYIFATFSLDSVLGNLRTINEYMTDGKLGSFFIWTIPVMLFVTIATYFRLNKLVIGSICEKPTLNNTFHLAALLHRIILFSLLLSPGLYYLYEFNRLYRFVFLLMLIYVAAVYPFVSAFRRLILFSYLYIVFAFFGFYYSNQLSYDYIIFGAPPPV